MSRVPRYRTSSRSNFLFLLLLLHVVSGTFGVDSEETTQRNGEVLLTEEKELLLLEEKVVVAGREERRGRRLGEQEVVYEERTSGKCTDGGAGWGYLTTKAACEEGAGVVGWSDVTASTASSTNYPRGCFLYNGRPLFYFVFLKFKRVV